MAEVGRFAMRRIEAIVDSALAEAGVAGVLPTPLEAIRGVARVRGVAPIAELQVRASARELLGAFWFEERMLYIDEAQSAPRRRFTEAHELMHALCPWHEAVLREDTEEELFRPVRESVECEANAGAGLLIFQGLRERAAGTPCSLETALALAGPHGASKHATVHHYALTHAAPVAMLTVGRFPRRDGSLPVWRSVESPAFRRRHGRAADHYPAGLRPGTALHALVEAARTTSDCPRERIVLGGRRLAAEAHYNRHAFLVLLAGEGRKDHALAA